MTIGIPNSLLYSKYHVFAETFFKEIGAKIVVSPNTNKAILDMGVNCCVDEACLPIKVFLGHICWLKDRCDSILVPRFVSIERRKYVCPMFCGLIEMIHSSIKKLPMLIDDPIYAIDDKSLFMWAKKTCRRITIDKTVIKFAFAEALKEQRDYRPGINDYTAPLRVALIGHPYIIHDSFLSMNLKKKLHDLGIGMITEDNVNDKTVKGHVDKLFKQPFWFFASRYYGATIDLYQRKIDGIVYISAFCCGVDSVVVELIKNDTQGTPILILKIDEHTGEAGFNTRIEAFADMLKRRATFDRYDPTLWKHVSGCKSFV